MMALLRGEGIDALQFRGVLGEAWQDEGTTLVDEAAHQRFQVGVIGNPRIAADGGLDLVQIARRQLSAGGHLQVVLVASHEVGEGLRDTAVAAG